MKSAGKDKAAVAAAKKAGLECEKTVKADLIKCNKDAGSSSLTMSFALLTITAATLFW